MKTKAGTRLSSAYAAGLAELPRPKHLGGKDSAASKEYERGRREAARALIASGKFWGRSELDVANRFPRRKKIVR